MRRCSLDGEPVPPRAWGGKAASLPVRGLASAAAGPLSPGPAEGCGGRMLPTHHAHGEGGAASGTLPRHTAGSHCPPRSGSLSGGREGCFPLPCIPKPHWGQDSGAGLSGPSTALPGRCPKPEPWLLG